MSSASQSNGSRQNSDNERIVAPSLLTSLEWRCVGPYRGGRVVAVAGDPSHSHTFYFGSTGGGVWKTIDGGLSGRTSPMAISSAPRSAASPSRPPTPT